MHGAEFVGFPYWWIFPLLMLVLCFFMMRRRTGAGMSGFGCCGPGRTDCGTTNPAKEILDQRYARGEIDQREYEERLRTLGGN